MRDIIRLTADGRGIGNGEFKNKKETIGGALCPFSKGENVLGNGKELGGRFSGLLQNAAVRWIILFGLPMLFSSVGTIFASGWTNGWKNDFAIVLAELMVENAVFYPVAWVCWRFLPKQKTNKQHENLLEGLVLVEVLDIILRLACFLWALKFPSVKGWLTGSGSLLLDGVFLISLSQSHRLVEIVRCSRQRFSVSGTIIKARCKAALDRPYISAWVFSRPAC